METLCEFIRSGTALQSNEVNHLDILFFAALNDDFLVINRLHSKGLDLNATDEKGKTAVFYANETRSMSALCCLIGCQAQFSLDEIDAKAVLFFAAVNDWGSVISALYSKGLDINATDEKGKTAVFYANENASMSVLCELIEGNAQFDLDEIDAKAVLLFAASNDMNSVISRLHCKGLDFNATDEKGKTAMFYANEKCSRNALCKLIECNAYFNLDEIDAKALLFFAAVNDKWFVIRRLSSKGLDLNATDEKGKTAMFYANEKCSRNALCKLIECNAHFNLDEIDAKALLFFTAVCDEWCVIRRLSSKGLDLNATDEKGKTAVFYANENRSVYALCGLIEGDAQFDLDEIDAKTVLFFAAVNDGSLVINRLWSRGLDLNATDEKGKTAVFYANKKCSMKALCELIECNAEFNLNEIDAKAVLFFAAVNDKFLVINRLNSKGLDLNATDYKGKTAVFYANKKCNMKALCELIESNAQFNLDEIDAQAVLFFAAVNNEWFVIRRLSSKGLGLNATDEKGKTAVFYANENRSIYALFVLIMYGAQFNLDEIDAKAVLFLAAVNNEPSVINRLYSRGLDLNAADDKGKTAMFYANAKCRWNALCQLIECNAHFNLDEIDAKAVLLFAASNDINSVISRLHWKGLDFNATDEKGKTAVFYANKKCSMKALCELIECNAEFNLNEINAKAVLFFAAVNDKFLVINRLNSKGLDLNATDYRGKTAVFHANKKRSMKALCELIESNAQFNLDEIDAQTVLFFAAVNDESSVINRLHSKGLDLNATDEKGKTAVFCANKNCSMSALCELIRCNAQFNMDEIDAKAVLFFAASNDIELVIRLLHSERLELNATDEKGKTALFYANENRSMNALCELIDSDAQFDLDEIDGQSVLFFAASNNMSFIINRLHSKGLDLNATDDKGKTAVFYANENRSMKALCELIECNVQFNLDEIDAKAVLFLAAVDSEINKIKPLYNAGLDLNVINDEGKTIVFYCDEDFLDDLIALDDNVVINARDVFGRTPLFYAAGDNNATKARHLIEKGGDLELKDNCSVNIFSFFVQNCIAKNSDALKSCFNDLFLEEHKTNVIHAIFDTIYCQSPLFSFTGRFPFPALYTIFNKRSILDALEFACDFINGLDNVKSVREVASRINAEVIDVPLVMSLLNKLGADANAADLDGNTAAHYAALLPFCGVAQEDVIQIFKTLRKFGSIFDLKNQQKKSPLQLCFSPKFWKAVTKDNYWQPSVRGFVEVCKYLLSNGCSITFGSQNAESIFHRIISLIQQSLELTEHAPRMGATQVLTDILILLCPKEAAVCTAVNNPDALLNSPLHLWASIALKSSQSYGSLITKEHTFESILRIIFDHFLKCGAKINLRNGNEETPLHVCRTWTAVKMLLDAGANPQDVDASGNSPLLAATKKKSFDFGTNSCYPDVSGDLNETFFINALKKGLDPWVVDKEGVSIMNIFIKSKSFILGKALVNAACKDNRVTNDRKLSLLNAICIDECKDTHWKSTLVELILNSATTERLRVESPLRLCCNNIVQFGLFDDKPSSIQQKPNEKTSYNYGQPPSKKRKTSELEKDDEENKKGNYERENDYSVHGRIANQLLMYGVDIHLKDSHGVSCLDIADNFPPLLDLLKKPIEIDSLPFLIPWTSVSDKRSRKLAKVARRQECQLIDQILYHERHIGNGSYGFVFAGINSKDGREVAVKRVERLRMQRAENIREIRNLIALADCEQVVRYISFFEDDVFSYVVLELMEGNLEEYLNESTFDATQETILCKDVIMGLKFLHEQKILHRDLKPRNILYKERPKPCLKIADFGLSRKVDSKCTTVYGTGVGTRCWIAPEVFMSETSKVDKDRFGPSSDMFSCGLILHYILSGQKHPFSPTDCSNKSEIQVCNHTETNIMKGKMEGWEVSLSPEASHLIKQMLESDENNRSSAQEALKHPLFWTSEKKMDFLQAVGNQKEFECPRSKRTTPLTMVETNLEKNFGVIVKHGSWINPSYKCMPKIHLEMTRGRGRKHYDTRSAVELVRFIRNLYQHHKDIFFALPVPIEWMLFDHFVFLRYFPDLVMEVYQVIRTHGWDKSKNDIKSVVSKK